MTPQDWSRIQQGIFAGESGGDYGALYNYQNRPNGRFSGIDVTKMTVDQALDFASPSGPYGQYVKSQVGRVATPMGAYQVVGSTLRDAKRAMGLKGDEVLTPQLQDQIGQWIYKTQGTGAWEGYKGAAENNTETKPMMQEQQPRGLLGSLGIQKRDEAAGGETAQPFYQRDTFKDTAATLAQGFAAMGSMPALQKMTADIAQQRTENKARNKTADYLKANGMEDIAELMLAGQIGAREVGAALVNQRLQKPKDDRTALMKNYEFFVGQGMSPEDAMQAVRSGTTIQMPGQKGSTEFEKLDAKTLSGVAEAGMQAGRSLNQINRLDALLENVPTGATGALKLAAGNFGLQTEGLDDLQAAEALINNLVPQQRPPGSGPMSDADLELFKRSLPRIINSPDGNKTILETMRGVAQYDAMGAEIVQRYRAGDITQAQAFAQLQARPDPFAGLNLSAGQPSTTMSREDALKVLGD